LTKSQKRCEVLFAPLCKPCFFGALCKMVLYNALGTIPTFSFVQLLPFYAKSFLQLCTK